MVFEVSCRTYRIGSTPLGPIRFREPCYLNSPVWGNRYSFDNADINVNSGSGIGGVPTGVTTMWEWE